MSDFNGITEIREDGTFTARSDKVTIRGVYAPPAPHYWKAPANIKFEGAKSGAYAISGTLSDRGSELKFEGQGGVGSGTVTAPPFAHPGLDIKGSAQVAIIEEE